MLRQKLSKMGLGENNCYKYVWSNDFSIMLQPSKFFYLQIKFHIILLVIHASLLSSV